MILALYSIKDELSEFTPATLPFEEDAQAKRWFRNHVKETPMMAATPEDFSIWKVATIDTKTGVVTGLMQPELTERAKGENSVNKE